MTAWIDITGKRYGLWVVEGLWEPTNRKFWRCRCDCGKVVRVFGENLRADKSHSCGCLRREHTVKHGMIHHPAYVSWNAARKRCRNPKDGGYANYGGRGIKFDAAWDDFNQFWADMGPTWFKKSSLDRINVNDDYKASNCRWATAREQANNRQRHATIQTPSGPMRMMEASIAYGIDYATLFLRVKRGWPASELFTPSTIDRKNGRPTNSRARVFHLQQIERAVIGVLAGCLPSYAFREGGMPMQEARDLCRDIEARLVSEDSETRAT